MPECFAYCTVKRRYVNTLPFLSFYSHQLQYNPVPVLHSYTVPWNSMLTFHCNIHLTAFSRTTWVCRYNKLTILGKNITCFVDVILSLYQFNLISCAKSIKPKNTKTKRKETCTVTDFFSGGIIKHQGTRTT